MPRPTGRGYALLALAVATYLAGRLVGTWELYLLALMFPAVLIVSWVLVAATGTRIRVTRSLVPDRPAAGDDPEITFTVKNTTLLPGPQLTVRSHLGSLVDYDLTSEIESLPPRGEKLLRTHIERVNRGVHLLPPAQAIVEDALGVVRAVRRVSEPLVVTVVPRVVLLGSCVLHPDIGLRHDWTGRKSLRTFGASEFRGVRPHQPGEPLSHIDWKSTAKTGVLMLREMEEPAGADITVLLDGTAAQVTGEPPENNFELAIRATGSIADFLLRAGRGVTLLCHERTLRRESLTADGSGRRALLQVLAETQPTSEAPLAEALSRLESGGPSLLRTQSVTIVSISLDQGLVRLLADLRDVGARPSFVYVAGGTPADEGRPSALLPFLGPREPIQTGQSDAGSASIGLHKGYTVASPLSPEARALLLSLSSAGIPCLSLSSGDDLIRRLSLWQPARRDSAVVV